MKFLQQLYSTCSLVAGMAFTDKVCILCVIFISRLDLGTSRAERPRADGAQPELFIFHESCALKKDEGPCKAVHHRFYFDIDAGRCEPFEYGGCKGNANNFEGLEACTEMCVVSAEKSPCHLEEAPGPCRGLVIRYFYDGKSQECKQFYYGGCFGNANNFRSMKDCQARCRDPGNTTAAPQVEVHTEATTSKPSVQPLRVTDGIALSEPQVTASHRPALEFTPPDFCLGPIDKGTCDRVDRRFAYNPKTRRCQSFRFSGCGGNKNNFVHKRHCVKKCMDMMRDNGRKIIRIRKKNADIIFRAV